MASARKRAVHLNGNSSSHGALTSSAPAPPSFEEMRRETHPPSLPLVQFSVGRVGTSGGAGGRGAHQRQQQQQREQRQPTNAELLKQSQSYALLSSDDEQSDGGGGGGGVSSLKVGKGKGKGRALPCRGLSEKN